MATHPSRQRETFDTPRSERDYEISMECPEFTLHLPARVDEFRHDSNPRRAGQALRRAQLADALSVVYCDQETFHEATTNKILDDLVAACRPFRMTISAISTCAAAFTR